MGRLFTIGFIKHFLMDEADDENKGGGGGDNKDLDKDKDKNSNDDNKDEDDNNSDKDKDKDNMESLPNWAQKTIKDLRSESASNRVKNKGLEERFGNLEKGLKSALGIEDDDSTPEEQVQGLTSQNQSLVMQNAVLETSVLHGLNSEQSEFFGYLLEKEINSAEREEELSDDVVSALILKAQGFGGGSGSAANSSIDGKGSGGSTGDKDNNSLTAEDFSKMGYGEKTALRKENEVLYNKLFNDARSKGLIR